MTKLVFYTQSCTNYPNTNSKVKINLSAQNYSNGIPRCQKQDSKAQVQTIILKQSILITTTTSGRCLENWGQIKLQGVEF